MHRTTIPLEGPIERELRELALHERRTFKELVNDLLKRGLRAYREKTKKQASFQWNVATGKPVPGFDPADRATYLPLISRRNP